MNPIELAQKNLQEMKAKTYPGRVIIVGLSPDGRSIVEVAATMGRGDDSRNRVYGHDGKGRVYTKAADPKKVKDPSQAQFIFYDTMMDDGSWYAVSNGHQTNHVRDDDDLRKSMIVHGFSYEGDPSSTPRITALCHRGSVKASLEMCIFKKSPFDDSCNYFSFQYPTLHNGLGHCLTTYIDDGKPLPSFCGEPILLPITGNTAEEVALEFWDILNDENRVSIVAKTADLATGGTDVHIINKYDEIAG